VDGEDFFVLIAIDYQSVDRPTPDGIQGFFGFGATPLKLFDLPVQRGHFVRKRSGSTFKLVQFAPFNLAKVRACLAMI
jgi:hypothetical protein